MKCMPGQTTRAYCLHCRNLGQVTGYNNPMVEMTCPTCGATWRTISAICENCHTPSGNPYYTDCRHCVGKTKQKESVKRGASKSTNQFF